MFLKDKIGHMMMPWLTVVVAVLIGKRIHRCSQTKYGNTAEK